MGHIKMMAAAQPFLSGAISKTVNGALSGNSSAVISPFGVWMTA
jgi:ribonucleotide reductase alpha subunit